MQIASGLHRVGSEIINSYLIVDQDGVTIIDAGLPGYWKLLEGELSAIGKTLADVRALILTHGDTDHIGFASRLYREAGVAGAHPRGRRRPGPSEGQEARLGLGRSRSARSPAFCGTPPVMVGCGSRRPRSCRA
jgi:glyoxylase-like metal-dependent hydrolase (beta-lactamase superfamily II)